MATSSSFGLQFPQATPFLLDLLSSMCLSSPEKPPVHRVLAAAGWDRQLSVLPQAIPFLQHWLLSQGQELMWCLGTSV